VVLRAVQPPVVAVRPGRGADGRDVPSGAGLGQGHRRGALAGRDRRIEGVLVVERQQQGYGEHGRREQR
jgi:hypothetical protein